MTTEFQNNNGLCAERQVRSWLCRVEISWRSKLRTRPWRTGRYLAPTVCFGNLFDLRDASPL